MSGTQIQFDPTASYSAAPPPPAKPTAAGDLTDMIGEAAKALAKVSGPNVIYEALRKAAPHLNLPPALGMPNASESMQAGLSMMIPETEGEAGIVKAGESVAPKAASAPGMLERIGKVAADEVRVPIVGRVSKYLDAIKGPETEPPAAPAAPVPETNGVQWGTGGQGPVELRGKMIPQEAPAFDPGASYSAAAIDTSRKAVGSAVDQSLNVQPLKPNVPLREQIPAKAQPAVEPKPSSAVQSHSYDPDAKEMQVTPKSNPNITYVYGDVAPDQAALFDSGSKGQAWKALRDSSSAPVAKIINGKRIPVKPMNRLATASPDDLTDVLQQSVQAVKKNRLAASAAAD